MLELLVVIAFAVAIKRAINDTGAAWGQSKAAYKRRAAAKHGGSVGAALRHDAGFLLSQVAHGFPQARHGFTAGWHDGRKAHMQARAETERARAEHAEASARFMPEIRGYRDRRKAALDEIRGRRPGGREEGTGEVPSAQGRGSGTEARPVPGGETPVPESPARSFWDREPVPVSQADWDAINRRTPRQDAPAEGGEPGEGTGEGTSPGPADYLITSDDGRTPVRTADPDAALEAARERSRSGTRAQVDAMDAAGNRTPVAAYVNGEPDPTMQGGDMPATAAADTTYNQELAELTEIQRDAEEEVNSVQRKRIKSRLDVLTTLALDPATLSDAAEIDDALKQQEEAAQKTLEAAVTALNGLKSRHGGVQEAVDNAPVDRIAQPEFYDA